jgi:hypothetical protein
VGGTLTHFAAPPVLMVAAKWNWDFPFMFQHFGCKALAGIIVGQHALIHPCFAVSSKLWRPRIGG